MVNGCDSALLECAKIIFFLFTFEYSYFLLRTVENGIKIKTAYCLGIIFYHRNENNSGLYITFYSLRFAE